MLRLRILHAGAWLLAGGLLGACSGTHEPTQTAPPAAAHAGVAPTTNVPALVGISIDELRSRLGAEQPLPASFVNSGVASSATGQLAAPDSLASFKTGGISLIANYNTRTRQVYDLLLLGHHEDSLMARATLRSSASHYLVLPVFASGRPNYLLGLRVIAAK